MGAFLRTGGGLAVWLVVLFALGGASRADEVSQHVLRSIAVVIATIVLLREVAIVRGFPKLPLLLLVLLAVLMAAQLIPLPSHLWQSLPGHSLLAEPRGIRLGNNLWRPVSLAPLATFNALLALSVPAATMLICAVTHLNRRRDAIVVCVVLGIVSAIVGGWQASGGVWHGVYRVATDGSAVGLFANRNHQALLLTVLLPMLAFVVGTTKGSLSRRRMVAGGSLLAAFLTTALLLVTGSRAGILLLITGACGAGALLWDLRRRLVDLTVVDMPWRHAVVPTAAVLIGASLSWLMVTSSRAESVLRALHSTYEDDLRWRLMRPNIALAGKYLPTGAGFGTYSTVFRIDEPPEMLAPTYVNHAHNEILETIIEGGWPALFLAGALAYWLLVHVYRAWADKGPLDDRLASARLGSLIVLQLFVGSLFDYPVRTPIFQGLLVLTCWLLWYPPSRRAIILP